VVPPLLRAFRPHILVTQHGCDSHRLDPSPIWN
jgi:acetoin utilization protein AcuC